MRASARGEVAEQHLQPSAVVHRRGRELREAEGHGVLVRPPQPEVALGYRPRNW